ncbi:hypothetical protein NM688_g7332 [Phlebia brevispora]|uniref:Uncharacterized protein n=1 Tax=Phlebia brevispora TaxID=194682 RepID=A0ACC1S6P0_9APHY|nr:hypothetical protein NM688_g7332 [Phlebia brevispora]
MVQSPTPRQKAAKACARHHLEEEENQRKDVECILATGPRLSKMRAGDKIREWNAPSRKQTIAQTDADSNREQEHEEVKGPKKPRPTKVQHQTDPRVNAHDHEDSDDSPLASAARKPLTPKAIIKNSGRSRKSEKKAEKKIAKEPDHLNNPDDDLHAEDWPSNNERGDCHGYGSAQSGEDGDHDSCRPSEESDSGNVNKSLEVPKWISKSCKKRPQSSVPLKTYAHNAIDDEELAGLIPDIDDSMRSRRSSTTSMRTASSVGPPPTTTTMSDDEEYHRRLHMTSDGGGSESDASSELPSRIGHLPPGPIASIRRPQAAPKNTDRYHEDNVGCYDAKQKSRRQQDMRATSDQGKTHRQKAAEAERSYFKEALQGSRRNSHRESARAHEDNYRKGGDGYRKDIENNNAEHYGKDRCREDDYRDEGQRPEDRYHDRGKRERYKDYHADYRRREDRRDIYGDEQSYHRASGRKEDMHTTLTSACASGSGFEQLVPSKWAAKELDFPERTRVVWTDRSKINIKDQTPLIQGIIETYIKSCLRDFVLTSGIPTADVRMKRQSTLLIEAADSYNAADIGDRIEEDCEAGPRFAVLLASSQWIYAGDVLKMLEFRKPFECEIFVQLLVAHFFNGPNAIGSSLTANFKSSLEGKPDEKEIPEAMLAVVAATLWYNVVYIKGEPAEGLTIEERGRMVEGQVGQEVEGEDGVGDPMEIWEDLKKVHVARGLASQLALHRRWWRMVKGEKESMSAWIGQVKGAAHQLVKIGVQVSDEDRILVLTNGLGSSYDSFVISLDATPAHELTLEVVVNRLLNEEVRRENRSEQDVKDWARLETAVMLARGSSGSGIAVKAGAQTCWSCGEVGHVKVKCPHRLKDGDAAGKQVAHVALSVRSPGLGRTCHS